MKERLTTLLEQLKHNALPFKEVIAFIDTYYNHQPTAFRNGAAHNEATQNQGSAKVFAFAQRHALSKEDTLRLFAEHYQHVLNNPDASDHQNIRQFMIHGWTGIIFEGPALMPKTTYSFGRPGTYTSPETSASELGRIMDSNSSSQGKGWGNRSIREVYYNN